MLNLGCVTTRGSSCLQETIHWSLVPTGPEKRRSLCLASAVMASKDFKSYDSLRLNRGGLFDVLVEMILLMSDLRAFLTVM